MDRDMIVKRFTPPDSLNQVIDYIWVVDSDFLSDEKREDIIMPLGHMNLILNFASNYMQIQEDDEVLIPDIALIGQIKSAKHVRYGQSLKQIGISLKPAGFITIFNKSGIAFTEQIVDAREIDPTFCELYQDVERLQTTNLKVHRIYEFLEHNYLNEKLTSSLENIRRISEMTTYIEDNCEDLNITEMAEFFYTSISTLERYFKKNVGLTPKNYGEIYKFRKNIEDEIRRKKIQNLYYDQSHLIKKTKKLSGKTIKELENIQSELTLQNVLHSRKS